MDEKGQLISRSVCGSTSTHKAYEIEQRQLKIDSIKAKIKALEFKPKIQKDLIEELESLSIREMDGFANRVQAKAKLINGLK